MPLAETTGSARAGCAKPSPFLTNHEAPIMTWIASNKPRTTTHVLTIWITVLLTLFSWGGGLPILHACGEEPTPLEGTIGLSDVKQGRLLFRTGQAPSQEPRLARIALGWGGTGIVGVSQLNGSGASAPTRPPQSSCITLNRAPGSQHSPLFLGCHALAWLSRKVSPVCTGGSRWVSASARRLPFFVFGSAQKRNTTGATSQSQCTGRTWHE